MKYECRVIVKSDADTLCRLYHDYSRYGEWQDNFMGFEVLEGAPGKAGFKGILHYSAGDRMMDMAVATEADDMPSSFVNIYEMGGTWNRCESLFKEKNGEVEWTMLVEFRFDGEIPASEYAFKKATLSSMEAFKAFAEEK